jgi:hypothetical protein
MTSSNNLTADNEDFQEVLDRGKRHKNLERMNALIQAKDEPEDERPHRRRRRSQHVKHQLGAEEDLMNTCQQLDEHFPRAHACTCQGHLQFL